MGLCGIMRLLCSVCVVSVCLCDDCVLTVGLCGDCVNYNVIDMSLNVRPSN